MLISLTLKVASYKLCGGGSKQNNGTIRQNLDEL